VTTFEITSPEGKQYEVDAPEGATREQAFEFFKKTYRIEPKPAGDQRSTLERIGTGALDPIHGGAQLLSRVPGASYVNRLNNWLAKKGVPLAEIPEEGGVDELVRQREAKIQAARGGEKGTDWWRAAGAVIPYLFGGRLLGAGKGLPGALRAGGTAGFLEPVTGPADRLIGPFEKPSESNEFWYAKTQQALEGAAGGAALHGIGKGLGWGLEAAGARLAERFPDSMKFQGRRKILERIREDKAAGGPTQTELARLVREANEKGIPMTLADFGDENVRALAGNVGRAEGPSRNRVRKFLTERDETEPAYLTNVVRRYLHGLHPGGDASAFKTAETLMEQRSKDAKPLYDEVAKLEIPMSPTLQVILEDPILQQALKPGFELERIRAAAGGQKFNPADLGLFPDEVGNIAIPRAPSARVIDIAKQGLDTLIEKERNDITGRLTRRGAEINYLRRALLSEMDRLDESGVYAKARAAWEGPSASLDALKFGRSVFTSHPEEFAAEFEKLSDTNKDFVRVGVADSAIEKILKVGLHGDEAKALVRSPWVREQLRPVFRGPADFDAFMQEIDYAIKRFETKRFIMGGSQTAERLAEDEAGGMKAGFATASIAHKLSGGNWLGAISDAYRWWRDIGFQPDPEMNDAIAKVLFGNTLPKGFRTPKLQNYGEKMSEQVQNLVRQAYPIAGTAAGQPPQ
jgi:hypothetical protein